METKPFYRENNESIVYLAGVQAGKMKRYKDVVGQEKFQVVLQPPGVEGLDGYCGSIGNIPDEAIDNLLLEMAARIDRMRSALEWMTDLVERDREKTRTKSTDYTPKMEEVTKTLSDLLEFAERNHCLHEETYRGGVIWEICSLCGAKWADDEGGKPSDAHKYPKQILQAQTVLKNHTKRDRE